MATDEVATTEVTVLTAADLHQSCQLYADLRKAVAEHHPDVVALVGDCLHAGEDMDGRHTAAEFASILASLPCEHLVFVRGVGGGVKVVEKWRFENPAGVSLERSNSAMSV